MYIYVLTLREGKNVSVVGTASTDKIAREWADRNVDNDYSMLELDNLTHLGMSDQSVFMAAAPLPETPVLTGDLDEDFFLLKKYITEFGDSMERNTAFVLKTLGPSVLGQSCGLGA
jgi:hypothetical protein